MVSAPAMAGSSVAAAHREGKEEVMAKLPRYVRINTLKISLGGAERELKKSGHTLDRAASGIGARRRQKRHTSGRSSKVRRNQRQGHRVYTRDSHIRELLVFQPKGKSDLSRVQLVKSGALVLQQKASCFPALALNPPTGSHVIDACAAPGSKTSHLAALMENSGRIFAFDRSDSRLHQMKKLLEQRGVRNTTAVASNFLSVDPSTPEYAAVSHIMLDPSCSSSGMSARPTTDKTEISALVANQKQLILHAMRFPAVQVIVYSTCSINNCENEDVIEHVLSTTGTPWKAVASLPWWPRRGVGDATCARACVRALLEDKTIGFFLCRLERTGASNVSTLDQAKPAKRGKYQ